MATPVFPFDIIALTLVPSAAFAVAGCRHLCEVVPEIKNSWRSAGILALLLALFATAQSVILFNTSPVDLVAHGAFYAPLALWGETWRFFSSIFIYDDNVIVLFNITAIAIVGTRLVQLEGVVGFLLVFLISSLTATAIGAVFDAQALLIGATAGTFAIATATLSRGGHRATSTFDRISRAVAIGYCAVTFARLINNDDPMSTMLACVGAASGIIVRNVLVRPSRLVRALAISACLATPFVIASFTADSPDLMSLAIGAQQEQKEIWIRLAALQRSRENGWMSDSEFAHRLANDVIAPLDAIVKTSDRWSIATTHWIKIERESMVLRRTELSGLADLMICKQQLAEAEAVEEESTREVRLDIFWHSLAELEQKIQKHPVNDRIQQVLMNDISNLKSVATDLEIWSTEAAISELRERINSENERSPASEESWGVERAQWLARKTRLEALAAPTETQADRISALQKRIAATLEAIR